MVQQTYICRESFALLKFQSSSCFSVLVCPFFLLLYFRWLGNGLFLYEKWLFGWCFSGLSFVWFGVCFKVFWLEFSWLFRDGFVAYFWVDFKVVSIMLWVCFVEVWGLLYGGCQGWKGLLLLVWGMFSGLFQAGRFKKGPLQLWLRGLFMTVFLWQYWSLSKLFRLGFL